ncbi:STAS domain-containing protein [Mycobacterium sp. Marseille-P9652]|uniref:STAS domain-containing protein n=1 Tax=Mycobacterium sp. Marseille-P9652 TaxID=2654950 RepID=UPI0012E8E7ED|nr:STAS domain-containing protein [Mycobacterium sp. Marseille-P9652]
MTTAITTVDCGGARIRAHCRHLATVVTIRGEIDADNVDAVGQHLRRFTLGSSPLVLDMSEVTHSGTVGFSLLSAFDDACREAGVEWTLVPSPAAPELLGDMFPVTASVHEALHDLADAIDNRRQLVLPLIKKTA